MLRIRIYINRISKGAMIKIKDGDTNIKAMAMGNIISV
jgi:hypothetical protein